jgi:uncharacterized membrane protein
MQRHQKFARWLISAGTILLVLNTIVFLANSNWIMLGINGIMIIAVIIYWVSIWMSNNTPE